MLRPGHTVALCVLVLLTIGVVMVNSAGMSVQPIGGTDTVAQTSVRDMFRSIALSRSTMYMGLALLALWATSRLPLARLAGASVGGNESAFSRSGFPFRQVELLTVGVGVLLALLLLVYLPGLGREVNGSSRWIELPIAGSLQPSELAKWGLIVLLAWYGASRASEMHRFWTGLLPGLIAAGAVAGLVILEDLGTGVLIGSVACLLLLAAGARVWQFALFVPVGIAGIIWAIMTSDYRVKRLTAFLNPYEDPQGTGYHMIQSMAAIAGGEGFGRGLGHGLQKFGYLPEDRTDFLFAVICEELGIAGAAVVILLYVGMLWAGLSIVRRERSMLLKLVGLGVLTTVGLQALINLAVVTGLGPTKGIALPLLSSGGTGWILTAASLGLLVAMDRCQATAEIALGSGGQGFSTDEPADRAPPTLAHSKVQEAAVLA